MKIRKKHRAVREKRKKINERKRALDMKRDEKETESFQAGIWICKSG